MNYGADQTRGVVVSSGARALPLRAAADAGLLDGIEGLRPDALRADTLDPILTAGRTAWTELHERLDAVLGQGAQEHLLVDQRDLALRLPFAVADYVDFYSSIHHATNLGRLLRPGTEPLLPNWRNLPVSYHGRAGTIVVSGTPVRRPCGLVAGSNGEPEYRPTARLDIELEVGVVVGGSTALGEPVSIDHVDQHLFGLVLLNDWSARDIQAYEYQPLGPHLGKSFATSISAWVTPLDTLRAFLVAGPPQDPQPSAHLRTNQAWGLDLDLRVLVESRSMRDRSIPPMQISATNFAGQYWTVAQQLAHLTANGASLRAGDLYGSGTVSGPDRGSEGSFIELSWGGERPLELPDGTTRTFLEDGDCVILEGSAGGDIMLGPVVGEILPARS
ncbi:MAG: fumarylacetoacetase [Acidimicrobiaceae bacterium]